MQDTSTRLTQAFRLCGENETAKRQLGENELLNLSMEPQYPIIILQYILTAPNIEYGQRAAIEFKKWAQNSWVCKLLHSYKISTIYYLSLNFQSKIPPIVFN